MLGSDIKTVNTEIFDPMRRKLISQNTQETQREIPTFKSTVSQDDDLSSTKKRLEEGDHVRREEEKVDDSAVDEKKYRVQDPYREPIE